MSGQTPRLTIKEAAGRMGVTPRFLQIGLQHEKFPFGVAVKMSSEWTYYINRSRFELWMAGRDMTSQEESTWPT